MKYDYSVVLLWTPVHYKIIDWTDQSADRHNERCVISFDKGSNMI